MKRLRLNLVIRANNVELHDDSATNDKVVKSVSIDKGDVEQIRNEQPAKKFAATGRVGPRVFFVSGCSCVARMGGPAGDVVGDAVKVAADVDAQFQFLGDFQKIWNLS